MLWIKALGMHHCHNVQCMELLSANCRQESIFSEHSYYTMSIINPCVIDEHADYSLTLALLHL